MDERTKRIKAVEYMRSHDWSESQIAQTLQQVRSWEDEAIDELERRAYAANQEE